MDRLQAARLDAWITREPPWDDEAPPPRCSNCGQFLPRVAPRMIQETTFDWCSGEPHVFTEDPDERIREILGEQCAKSYTRAFPPACGSADGTGHGDGEEISPGDAESYRHEPHYYETPCGHTTRYIRHCAGCGARNEEIVI